MSVPKNIMGSGGATFLAIVLLLTIQDNSIVESFSIDNNIVARPSSIQSSNQKFDLASVRQRSPVYRSRIILPASKESEGSELSYIGMKLLALVGKSTSSVVSVVFFAALAWKRDAFMVTMFVGSIGNAILSKLLKKIINQTRPPELESADMKLKPSDGGMPSSHAMSLGFIGTFTALSLPWTQPYLLAYSVISLVYRVQSKLHTWEQVVVGFTLGSANSFVWFRKALPTVADFTTKYVLNDQGLLPIPLLVIPVIVGILVVGSVERRIGNLLQGSSETDGKTD